MAKLTGEALPTPPRSYFPPPLANGVVTPLPTLGDLRERSLRRNNTVTGIGGSREEGQGSRERTEARVNLMRKLSSRRLESPAAKDSLEVRDRERERARLDVVGRRGKARPRSGSVGDWRPAPAVVEWPVEGLRLPVIDVGSPLAVSFAPAASEHPHGEGERSHTSFSMRSSGQWTAERDRQSVLARMTGETAWEFEERGESRASDRRDDFHYSTEDEYEDAEEEVIRDTEEEGDVSTSTVRLRSFVPLTHVDEPTPPSSPPPKNSADSPPGSPLRRNSSADSSPPSSSNGNNSIGSIGFSPHPLAVSSAFRRSSIPHHLLSEHSTNPHGPSSFGIGAVEETDVRRRGSSASSSVMLLDPARAAAAARRESVVSETKVELGRPGSGQHWTTSDEAVVRLSDLASPEEQEEEVEEEEVEEEVQGPLAGEGEWTLKDRRLVAKVERKREAGMARSKEGAFPPPDEGYQFPSPTLGVRSFLPILSAPFPISPRRVPMSWFPCAESARFGGHCRALGFAAGRDGFATKVVRLESRIFPTHAFFDHLGLTGSSTSPARLRRSSRPRDGARTPPRRSRQGGPIRRLLSRRRTCHSRSQRLSVVGHHSSSRTNPSRRPPPLPRQCSLPFRRSPRFRQCSPSHRRPSSGRTRASRSYRSDGLASSGVGMPRAYLLRPRTGHRRRAR